jgi:hypothetical protein
MTLKSSFQDLVDNLEHLRATLEELLQWAIIEGKPEQEDHVLVSRYDDATSDLAGLVEEARAAARQGQQAVANRMDMVSARQALIACQERMNQVSQRFFSEMISFEALKALDSLAKERRKAWPQWVSGVKDALYQCRQPIEDVTHTLLECWKSVSEHIALASVSMKAISSDRELKIVSSGPK